MVLCFRQALGWGCDVFISSTLQKTQAQRTLEVTQPGSSEVILNLGSRDLEPQASEGLVTSLIMMPSTCPSF